MSFYRDKGAAQRYNDRRQREDAAPRLSALIPELETLRLVLREGSASDAGANPEGSHVRPIVVATAPALFFVTCHDTACKEGGHDLTHDVMQALRAHRQQFEGQSSCNGALGSTECRRVLRFTATATYKGA
jgi:hypothetical protein